MPKIILQVGHWNIEQITNKGLRSWRSIKVLRKSTGASGEREYNHNKIAPMLKKKLEDAGFEVTIVDAIYSNEVIKKADLWVSLHYDGGGNENRCMISSPKRGQGYLHAKAHDKADKFCESWREVYPKYTGAINRNERITVGMLEYYGFDYVNMDTPAVIIEHFNHTSERGGYLKQHPEKVAHGDYLAILKFFGKDETTLETFTLETDIPKEVEEQYKLKEYTRYSKHWTFGDFIKDWVKIIDDVKKLQKDYNFKLDKLQKQVNILQKEKKGLELKLDTKDEEIKILRKQSLDKLTVGQTLMLVWERIKDLKLKK